MTILKLNPGQVTLKDLFTIYRDGVSVTLLETCRPRVEAAAAQIAKAAEANSRFMG